MAMTLFLLAASATLTIALPGRLPAGLLECGSFLLLAWTLWNGRHEPIRWNLLCAALSAVPLLGLAQIATGTTVSGWLTANAILQWTSWAALAWIAAQALAGRESRLRFLEWFAALASLIAIVCLAQPALGISYDLFAGPFQNRNTYASLVELALPAVMWLALHQRERRWIWWPASALLASSVLVTGSRAGSALVLTEFGILLIASLGWSKKTLALGALAAALAAIAGVETLSWRIRLGDPLSHRREFLQSAFHMAAERPLSGFGLGTFPEAYPRHAIADFGRTVNHVHNDWLEWTVEGGIFLPLLLALAIVPTVATLRRNWWAAGILAVAIHAFADYPFARSGLAVWVWILGSAALRRPSFARVPRDARESTGLVGRSLATARH